MAGGFLIIAENGSEIPLGGGCTIGRQAGNQIVLGDDRVSRQHALIQWQRTDAEGAGGYLLIDLGSSNGTLLNGVRISRPTVLTDGDAIDIGGHRIDFRGPSGPELTPGETVGSTVLDIRKRSLWLMVGDIIGSTRRSHELPPEEVPRVNGAWFKTCRDLVVDHGGQMNQYLGDGFLAFWEDTLEAKSTLPALLRRFAALQGQGSPDFRLVLHYGQVVLGSVPTLANLNLHGPSVNFVFRMEKLAGSLALPLLLSAEAAKALRMETEASHQATLAGFDGTHDFVVPRLPEI
jgi:class 3 adenylate cyclase